MTNEKTKLKDNVSFVLRDKDGKVKDSRNAKSRSLWKRIKELLRR